MSYERALLSTIRKELSRPTSVIHVLTDSLQVGKTTIARQAHGSIMVLADDEEILREGTVTQILSYEGVGGKLLLTSKRLIFISHSLNFQSREEDIAIKHIIAVVSMHSDYFSRKISIYLKDNTVREFIIYKRKAWVQHICDVAKAMNHEIKVHSSKQQLFQGAVAGKGYTFFAGMLARAIFLGLLVACLMFLFLR